MKRVLTHWDLRKELKINRQETDISEFIPVRNFQHEIVDGLVVVIAYRTKQSFLDRTIFKKWAEKPVKIDLDEIGSYVWKLIDGKRNVLEITTLAEEHFNEKIQPAKERVSLFLKQLHKNNLITLYMKS